jgi:hypothetical protein
MAENMRFIRQDTQRTHDELPTEEERAAFRERFTEEDAEMLRQGLWA